MFMADYMETLTIALICLVLFAAQLLLCFKTERLTVKLIPGIVLLVSLGVSLILTLTASGWDSLVYIVFVLLSGIFLIPCAAGWIIWFVCCYFNKRKNDVQQ